MIPASCIVWVKAQAIRRYPMSVGWMSGWSPGAGSQSLITCGPGGALQHRCVASVGA